MRRISDSLRAIIETDRISGPRSRRNTFEEALKNGAILTGKGVEKGKSAKPRILITGCPNIGVRDKILYALEDAGASIVAFDSCNGVKTMREMVDENDDPYHAMAVKTLKANCSVMSPNPGRYESLREACEEFGIRLHHRRQ